MKKANKEISTTAKKLFQVSFTSGKLDKNVVYKIAEKIQKTGDQNSFAILKAYTDLIENYLSKETLVLESPHKIHPRFEKEIKSYFEILTGKNLIIKQIENSKILGGIRITLADNQWDFSLKGRLNSLREAL